MINRGYIDISIFSVFIPFAAVITAIGLGVLYAHVLIEKSKDI